MKHYSIHCPGMVYAVDEYGSSKKQAILAYKKRWGLDRMPRGFSIWES